MLLRENHKTVEVNFSKSSTLNNPFCHTSKENTKKSPISQDQNPIEDLAHFIEEAMIPEMEQALKSGNFDGAKAKQYDLCIDTLFMTLLSIFVRKNGNIKKYSQLKRKRAHPMEILAVLK